MSLKSYAVISCKFKNSASWLWWSLLNKYLILYADFEDFSCDMVYGQVPPPFNEDPVSTQPCNADMCMLKILWPISWTINIFLLHFLILRFSTGSMANPSSKVCPELQNWKTSGTYSNCWGNWKHHTMICFSGLLTVAVVFCHSW